MSQNFIATDGYIDRQSRCKLPLGNYPSSYNGCGWIATYNYMQLFKEKFDTPFNLAKEICGRFNAMIKLKGKFGIFPSQIKKVTREYGYCLKTQVRFSCWKYKPSEKGIIFYWTGNSGHYVMYEHYNDNLCIFYNVGRGREICSYADFVKRYVKLGSYIHFN